MVEGAPVHTMMQSPVKTMLSIVPQHHEAQQELQKLTTRVGEVSQEVATKLPKLQEGNEALQAELARVSAALQATETRLAKEVEARCEVERGLGRDMRELVKAEIDQAREMVVREMRERMDGQKVLREEVQLQQQSLMSFTGRVDEAIMELRTELPRLGLEGQATRAELAKISEEHTSFKTSIATLGEAIHQEGHEQRLSMQSQAKELREHVAQEVQCLREQFVDFRTQVDELSSRSEAEHAALGKELRDYVIADTERADAQVLEFRKSLNELRMRTDVAANLLGKDLRDHVASEVQRVTSSCADLRRALGETGSRLEEADKVWSKELRENLALESKDLREHIALEREQCTSLGIELRRLLTELSSRMDTSQTELGKDLREYVVLESERLSTRFEEIRKPVDELAARTDATRCEARLAQERLEQLAQDVSGTSNGLERIVEKVQANQESAARQASTLEGRLTHTDMALRANAEALVEEAKTGMLKWVEETVVTRVNTLDRGLRTEMGERSVSIQQVATNVTHNADRWCQLQAKFDQILLELNRSPPM